MRAEVLVRRRTNCRKNVLVQLLWIKWQRKSFKLKLKTQVHKMLRGIPHNIKSEIM